MPVCVCVCVYASVLTRAEADVAAGFLLVYWCKGGGGGVTWRWRGKGTGRAGGKVQGQLGEAGPAD